MSRRPPLLLALLGILVAVMMGGCGLTSQPDPASGAGTPPGAGTRTPLLPSPPTPTADVVRVWLDPSIPEGLRESLEQVAGALDGRVVITPQEAAAAVRLVPGGEVPLATWVYALVAPFPSLEDDVTSDALRAAWTGEGGLILEPATAEALASVLGEPDRATVEVVPPSELLDAVWRGVAPWAIVPFEALEPRWKVLSVDGHSPIRRGFDAGAYPLRVTFGLNGEPAAVAAVQAAVAEAPEWSWTNRDPDRLTVVVMTGVTALTRATAWRMDTYGVDYPGLEIGDWLREADLAHTSHEVPFSEDCPPADPGQATLRFCSDPRNVGLFASVGLDVIELTGNHILDWGAQAFLFTLDLYRQQGLGTFAGGEDADRAAAPYLFEHNGNRIAFLGCNAAGPSRAWATESSPGGLRCDAEVDAARVADLRALGYIPVFTFQWPESYRAAPLPDQVAAFRRMADAGAAIVSGSQAHRPQSFEFYGDGLIHYGLGNLFFDQMWSEATRQELIDRHVFYAGRHISTEVLTAYLEDYAQPRPMTPEERISLLEEIFRASGW